MLHRLRPERRTLHGILSSNLAPALTIAPGDLVEIETLEPDWRLRDSSFTATSQGEFFPRRPGYDDGHALCGPIAVKGAKIGQTLAVTVLRLCPANWGWSRVGGGGDADHAKRAAIDGEEYFLHWQIDAVRKICISSRGHRVPLSPFLGVMAVAPEETIGTHVPGIHGGNLDCREIVPGSTLYLPVLSDGALFSTGDGHAAQGNGEVGGTAIECPMKEALLSFELIDQPCGGPVCKTPEGWITFGFSSDLTQAAYDALGKMARLLAQRLGVSHKEALAICSVFVDLRITQIVNGIRGVHAVLPNRALHGTIE